MKKFGLKLKLAATALAFAGMFTGITTTLAGTLTGIGFIRVASKPYISTIVQKSTADRCSDITLGNVSVYGSIQVTTYSEISANQFEQSNPWTICAANSSTYLGQYVSVEPKVGQKIYFLAKALESVSDVYDADIISWDYH